VEYEIGLMMKAVAKAQRQINGKDGADEEVDDRSVAIMWAGSMHDSDRSTMHMDTSSSIWRPDMDEYWDGDWRDNAVM